MTAPKPTPATPVPDPAPPLPEQEGGPGIPVPELPDTAYPEGSTALDDTPLDELGDSAADRLDESIRQALAAIDESHPSVVTPDPVPDPDADPDKPTPPDPPVYDERGNVRPRGTPGAVPMTKAKRIKIARALAAGDEIVTSAERPPRK
jgi:hypothetical protein